MPIPSKMRTLADAGLYKYKWCNNLREVEQVDIFFLKDIADTIRYFVGNNIGFLYHNESKLFVCVPNSSTTNVQHAVSQLFNSNIVVEYQNNSNIIDILSEELSVLLGEGNYSIKIDNEEQIIIIDVPFAMSLNLDKIKIILNRTYLMNLDIELLDDGVPVTYTHLEYLETSGTQWSSLGKCPTYIGARAMLTYNNLGNRFLLSTVSGEFIFLRCVQTTDTTVGMWGTVNHIGPHVWPPKEVVLRKVEIFQNWKMDGNALLKDPYSDWTYDYSKNVFTSQLEEVDKNLWLFTYNGGTYNFMGKIYHITISQHEDIYMDLVPILDENGTPCMYDKISRTCFYNQGTGTFGYRIKGSDETIAPMSLRDPYYTAPSGVWAKLIAENELDIIADTDMQDGEGQGYTWFANTGEAYEHFGIKEEPLNNI